VQLLVTNRIVPRPVLGLRWHVLRIALRVFGRSLGNALLRLYCLIDRRGE
jgi:hypothetical protein